MDAFIQAVQFDAQGLVTAIAQDASTGEILMVAYMNEDTLRRTLQTGIMTYWSRSRKKVWVKGESSGHTQHVELLVIPDIRRVSIVGLPLPA